MYGKNIDGGREYRAHCVRPVCMTEVKILPYRPTKFGKKDVHYMVKPDNLTSLKAALDMEENFAKKKVDLTDRKMFSISLTSFLD